MMRTYVVAAVASAALVLLAGCQVPGLTSTAGTTSAGGATPAPGPTWERYAPGKPQPSPAVGVGIAASVLSNGRYTDPPLSLPPYPTGAAYPSLSPRAEAPLCDGWLREGKFSDLGVVTGTGTATVSWHNAGDPNVTSYKAAAVAEDLSPGAQAQPTWITVAAGTQCVTMTGTFNGLRSKGRYVFWVDAVRTRTTGTGPAEEIMIGRTPAVVIP